MLSEGWEDCSHSAHYFTENPVYGDDSHLGFKKYYPLKSLCGAYCNIGLDEEHVSVKTKCKRCLRALEKKEAGNAILE